MRVDLSAVRGKIEKEREAWQGEAARVASGSGRTPGVLSTIAMATVACIASKALRTERS
jgi:hypothetical protein